MRMVQTGSGRDRQGTALQRRHSWRWSHAGCNPTMNTCTRRGQQVPGLCISMCMRIPLGSEVIVRHAVLHGGEDRSPDDLLYIKLLALVLPEPVRQVIPNDGVLDLDICRQRLLRK